MFTDFTHSLSLNLKQKFGGQPRICTHANLGQILRNSRFKFFSTQKKPCEIAKPRVPEIGTDFYVLVPCMATVGPDQLSLQRPCSSSFLLESVLSNFSPRPLRLKEEGLNLLLLSSQGLRDESDPETREEDRTCLHGGIPGRPVFGGGKRYSSILC